MPGAGPKVLLQVRMQASRVTFEEVVRIEERMTKKINSREKMRSLKVFPIEVEANSCLRILTIRENCRKGFDDSTSHHKQCVTLKFLIQCTLRLGMEMK